MNPHENLPENIFWLSKKIVQYRNLIIQMTKRDITSRYQGSMIGLTWSIINPIVMLLIYTFVFSVIFKAKWTMDESESKSQFAVILFVGMIVNSFFSEVFNRAPQLIVGNVNYIKKVVFPIEILPIVSTLSVLFHALISIAVLLIALIVLNGGIPITALYTPIIFLPLIIFCTGISYIFSSLGVFLRDIGQATAIISTIMMFLSPVFFPMSAIPKEFQIWIMMNPLTFIIEQARAVMIFGNTPDWIGLITYTCFSLVVFMAGFLWFQRTRKGFADVL